MLWLLLLVPVLAGAQPTPRELVIDNGSQSLAGTLLEVAPADAPLAIIIAGSGPTDRDGNQAALPNDSLKLLAAGLADQGIASFRYDKRGVGKSLSAAAEEDLRIQDFAGDAAAIAREMGARYADRSLYLIGHSEGSLLALMAAAQVPVAGVISIAGPGRPAADILREQLAPGLPAALYSRSKTIIDRLQAGQTVSEVPAELAALFRPSVQPYLISWFALDPAALAGQLDVPVLVVQGSTDLQTGAVDACRLAAAGEQLRVVMIEGMNHVLKPAGGGLPEQLASYSDPGLPLHPELLPALVAFMDGQRPGATECPAAVADAPQDPACTHAPALAGTWAGRLSPPGIRLVFHLRDDDSGCLEGRFDSPDQGAYDLPLTGIGVDGEHIEIRADGIGFVYRGQRVDNEMEGTFFQGAAELPLTLTREIAED